ncbi:hypothetical protein [Anabaena azotica]|uniref:Uncharacterized protein n=1 Tax=Anabaena azotica FACHB-119 TaxID=947527 RepID=A0ABR8D6I9_9NOST|nr:hypothetical protein [Anabaena azotica]MBD2502512.1 hypothetical protein [Anabaena azotica FACHB-119]
MGQTIGTMFVIMRKNLTVNSYQLSVKYVGETPHQLMKSVAGGSKSPTIRRQD